MGGEKYSKEAFDKAVENLKSNDDALRPFHYASIANAKERVDTLFNAGRKEAVGTNKEYDKKVLRFMEEIENFSKFAVDELGMKRGKAREIFKTIIDSVLEDIIDDVNLEDAVKKENI